MLSHVRPPPHSETPSPSDRPPEWDEEYELLLGGMEYEPLHIDLLIQRTGLTAESVSSMLLLLELEGYVSPSPGGRYCLTGKYHGETGGDAEALP